jgi:luciferase family oxidoreductase group 1
VRLSILDFSPVATGSTASEALERSIDLAERAEALGYERYWMAEHHDEPALACTAPEIVISRLIAATSCIRLGAGGVLLSHYSPLKVAETFRTLQALAANRIDLGIGRARGGEIRVTEAMRPHPAIEADFEGRILKLIAYLKTEEAETDKVDIPVAFPATNCIPPVWLLGSSLRSAAMAARLSLPYAYAHFLDPTAVNDSIDTYRRNFRPSVFVPSPQTILAVHAVTAETAREAERQAASFYAALENIGHDRRRLVPSPEEADSQRCLDPVSVENHNSLSLWFGTPTSLASRLRELARQANTDELMISTIVHDHTARRYSYQLLANAFNLEPKVRRTSSGNMSVY